MWENHVAHMTMSCPTYERVMSHIWKSHVSHMKESCPTCGRKSSPTYQGVMSHPWMRHVTHMMESWPTYHEHIMFHLWITHVKHVEESCHIHGLDVVIQPCPLHQGVMTYISPTHHIPHMNHTCPTCGGVMSHTWIGYCNTLFDSITGWWRLIGSPNLQIIFHKRATKYRSLLRKMTYNDKGSYESSPPCTWIAY